MLCVVNTNKIIYGILGSIIIISIFASIVFPRKTDLRNKLRLWGLFKVGRIREIVFNKLTI